MRKLSGHLTQARLKEALHYAPDTGVFTWAAKVASKVVVGRPAGGDSRGHIAIRLDGVLHLAHRLAFLYMTGEWPAQVVDHINGVRTDNRWANLRDVAQGTNTENQRRAHSRSKSGLLGASPHAAHPGKWCAFICSAGKNKNLGTFDTAEAAHEAYKKAKRELHEGCTI